LPLLTDKVERMCEDAGLRNDAIVMRMTGCPNGCARPYIAEVAFVGKAPGTYLMLLGGGFHGQRLNKIYREAVTEPKILAILGPMIKRYALERESGEHFGDWVVRAGYIAPPVHPYILFPVGSSIDLYASDPILYVAPGSNHVKTGDAKGCANDKQTLPCQ
jgi:sulfite reductase beta subunit-like hemoprotein